ncbi:hypothetical protein BROC_01737 [Candidatus Brocadiaceae bacterium]|nr:hypothetical protein BROC_01737 [Candidatus Brocadiaceae bacterium]
MAKSFSGMQRVMTYRLLSLLDGKISPIQMQTLKRMIEDGQPSLSFALNYKKQRLALQERDQCQTLRDYMAFTTRWLGVGSVQIPEEIGGALDYIDTEKPLRVCEIGTEDGGTTFLLSNILTSAELIIGVDLYIQNRPQLTKLHRHGQRLVLMNGSSYALQTVRRVEKTLNGASLDVLFIDGDHDYEGVKKDFLMYKHLVCERGFILFHDIVQDYAARYGKATPAYSGGVPAIWSELKQIYPSREFVQNPEQNGMGIGVIRYSSSIELPAWFS